MTSSPSPDRDAVDATDLEPGGGVTPGATPPDTNPVSGSLAPEGPPPTSRFSQGAIITFVVVGVMVVFLLVAVVLAVLQL
jgi:hypothetical protein